MYMVELVDEQLADSCCMQVTGCVDVYGIVEVKLGAGSVPTDGDRFVIIDSDCIKMAW